MNLRLINFLEIFACFLSLSSGVSIGDLNLNQLTTSLNSVEESILKTFTNLPKDIQCDRSEFKCSNGIQCIDNEDVCNKVPQCADESDEGEICLSLSGSKRERRGFDEFCNQQLKCNSTIWLSCIENKCQCAKPDEMTYDTEQKKCLALANEVCKYEIGKIGDLGLYETIGCVQNANCTLDQGKCQCLSNYEETDEGFCQEKADFGNSCGDLIRKSCKDFLACENGICTCNKDVSIFSTKLGVCVGLSGQNCLNGKCIQNSNCNLDESAEGECICNEGFYDDKNQMCSEKKAYSEVCEESGECKDQEHLKCFKGKCDCDSSYSIWNATLGYCVGIPEQPCINAQCSTNSLCFTSSQGHTNWIANGYYSFKNSYDSYRRSQYNSYNRITQGTMYQRSGICKCEHPDFKVFSDKTRCSPFYAKQCSLTNPCDPDFFICKNGKCDCISQNQVYDSSSGICKSKSNGPCKIGQNPDPCYINAHCIINQYNISTCQCMDGFVEVLDGQCKPSYGSKCTYSDNENNDPCENVTPLYCINGKCECRDMYGTKYDEKSRKCLKLVGENCEWKMKSECVKNSFCNLINGLELSGRCECKEGYQVTGERTCTEKVNNQSIKTLDTNEHSEF